MAKEIERKFLVANDGWQNEVTSQTAFRQGYVASLENRSVRIRLMDRDSATLTIKIGASNLIRDEYEYAIPVADAEELISTAIGIIIEKTRYTVDHGGFVWEVDVFGGIYTGLIVAEVELASLQDKPELPSWIGAEVTGDRRFSNQILATEDLSDELCHVLSY
jgi:CYTH domain-containing protein